MAQVILSDENCGGHARAIFHALKRLDYIDLLSLELRIFEDVGLPINTDDETVWRFCQENRYLLLTGNRTTKHGNDSLELTVRRLVTPTSLPVLTKRADKIRDKKRQRMFLEKVKGHGQMVREWEMGSSCLL